MELDTKAWPRAPPQRIIAWSGERYGDWGYRMWKITSYGGLVTKYFLQKKKKMNRRKITEDPLSPICGLEEETTLHILWECPSARDVWCVGSTKLQKSPSIGMSFLEIVDVIFKNCTTGEILHFAGIARLLWLRRNEVVRGGPFLNPNVLVQ